MQCFTRNRGFKYSVPQLIELVKARPIIWDSTRPDFRTYRSKERAWEEIYQILDDKYCSADESTQLDMGIRIVSKWRNIRDAFIRSFRKRALYSNVKKYMYHKELSFMIKLLDAEHQSEENKSQDESLEDDSTIDIKTEPEDEHSNYDTPITAILKIELEDEKPCSSIAGQPSLKRNDSGADEATRSSKIAKLDLCGSNVEEKSSQTISSPDEDESFFASIMSLVRDMTADEKIEFRMAALRQIQEIRLKRCMANSRN